MLRFSVSTATTFSAGQSVKRVTVMNTPNKLTVFRMLITPIFLAVILHESKYRFFAAAFVFAVGAATDAFDGRLARKRNQITVVGKLLDPLADKMLTTAALLAFMYLDLCNIWIVMIVLTREFAVTSVRLVASSQGVIIPANIWGKVKTASQMTFTVTIMLLAGLRDIGIFLRLDLALVSNGLLWITAVLAVVSGVKYLAMSRTMIDFSK